MTCTSLMVVTCDERSGLFCPPRLRSIWVFVGLLAGANTLAPSSFFRTLTQLSFRFQPVHLSRSDVTFSALPEWVGQIGVWSLAADCKRYPRQTY
jgi:hypothetical protein